MRLLDLFVPRPAEAATSPERAAYPIAHISTGSPNTERIEPTWFNGVEALKGSGIIFGLVLARVQLLSQVEFKFQRYSDKGLFGSPALGVLEEPWPGGTTMDLVARMEVHASIAGNAYVRRVRVAGNNDLELLRPDWVTVVSEVVRDDTDEEVRRVMGYFYDPVYDPDREAAFYPVEDVAHWAPFPDPTYTHLGMSWMTPVLREVDGDVQMTDYKRAYLTNAATPNLIIKYPNKLDEKKVSRLSAMIKARHTTPGNAFRTMVLDEGADPMVVGGSFEQMAFDKVQAAGENRLAVAASVPAIVAGLKEGLDASTYSNYEQAMRRFGDLFGRTSWMSLAAALAKLVDVQPGARLWFDTSGIAALREGDKERAETMQVLAAAAEALIRAGFTPESATAALAASDVTLLKHSGLVSVQMQTPGSTPGATTPQAPEEE